VWSGSRWDWLIAFMLAMATIQCVRADFLMNETFIDWQRYAAGSETMPYQGRVGMMPVLRAAERSGWFRRGAARFGVTITTASLHQEPVTVEKVASMLAGLVSLAAMMGVAFWWSRRRGLRPWWLADVLVLAIAAVTLVLRATQNFWYAYDLPHAALFGCAVLLGMEDCWWAAFALFGLDLPMRETSIFLVPVFTGLLAFQPSAEGRRRWLLPLLTFAAMLAAWFAVRRLIGQAFAHNANETLLHTRENLHQLVLPHHWPQLFSAGGYLAIFIWLARRRLQAKDRWVLYAALLCVPVTMLYGVWTETRVWLEWTLPLAALGAAEISAVIAGTTLYPPDRQLLADWL